MFILRRSDLDNPAKSNMHARVIDISRSVSSLSGSRSPGAGRVPRKVSGVPILFLRPEGESHAVSGPPGNAEAAVPAFRHLFEKIGRGPVDELHEESVREGADDLE